jgi:SpoVK/Ycf46/Vps4 family AAA+-type ATPase
VLWQGYPGGIYLTVVQNPGEWRTKTSIHAIPPVGGTEMSTAAQSRLTDLAARHRQFLKDKVHRCYLFFGPPGTGKTTAACVLSAEFGGRILKLDAVSLPHMTIGEMEFLLETLKPSFLLVDDVDLAPMDGVGPRVLYLMEHLKAHFPEIAIILTANDPSKLPAAWLRCGRIDIPVEFEAPTGPERAQMVASLLTRYGADPGMTQDVILGIEKDDLPHANLDDLCRRLRHESLGEVLASLRLLKALSALASAPPAAVGASPCPSPS